MATKTLIMVAALVATSVVLPLAAADITVSAYDPTTHHQIASESLGTNAASCQEKIANQTSGPAPSCNMNF